MTRTVLALGAIACTAFFAADAHAVDQRLMRLLDTMGTVAGEAAHCGADKAEIDAMRDRAFAMAKYWSFDNVQDELEYRLEYDGGYLKTAFYRDEIDCDAALGTILDWNERLAKAGE